LSGNNPLGNCSTVLSHVGFIVCMAGLGALALAVLLRVAAVGVSSAG
jgi:hypothetical protein